MKGRKSRLWSLLPLALFLLDLCFVIYYRRVIRVRELQTFSVGPLAWLNGYGALPLLWLLGGFLLARLVGGGRAPLPLALRRRCWGGALAVLLVYGVCVPLCFAGVGGVFPVVYFFLTHQGVFGALGILLAALPALPVGRTAPGEGTEELPQP